MKGKMGVLLASAMAMALQTGKIFERIPFYRTFGPERGSKYRVRSSAPVRIINTAFYGKAGYREYIRSKQPGWAGGKP